MNSFQKNPANVFQLGAIDGLSAGAYFSAMFLLQACGVPSLMLLGQVMMIMVPILAYIKLRNGLRDAHWRSTLSAIWIHGILMFLGGSIILAVVAYVYMRFVNPEYIYQIFQATTELYLAQPDPSAQEVGRTLEQMAKTHSLPTPITLAMGFLWLGAFSGAMLSLFIAIVLRIIARAKVNRNTDNQHQQ